MAFGSAEDGMFLLVGLVEGGILSFFGMQRPFWQNFIRTTWELNYLNAMERHLATNLADLFSLILA